MRGGIKNNILISFKRLKKHFNAWQFLALVILRAEHLKKIYTKYIKNRLFEIRQNRGIKF